MNVHELKVWPEFWDDLVSGVKPFEVRKNDRDYQVGDLLVLRAWLPGEKRYPDWRSPLAARVTYVMHGGRLGVEEGHVVMGIKVLR